VTDKNWDSGGYNGWVFSLSGGKVWFNIGDGSGHRIDLKSVIGFNDNAWHHAAASVSRSTLTGTGTAVLYVDGVNVASASATALLTIQSGYPLTIGMDPNGKWVYEGQLDEVKIWKVALSQDQIREKMHLTTGASEPNLIHYYQFNDANTTEYDRAGGGNNLTMGTAASRTNSHAPVGSGTAYRMTVNSTGAKDFTGTNCQITFPASGTYPNGELVVSVINVAPDQNPVGGAPLSKYWIIRNFGANSTFSALTSISFSNLGNFGTAATNTYKLFKRASNANGATWGSSMDIADALTTTNNNTLTFSTGNGITSFSQFNITTNGVLPIELLDFKAILNNKKVDITWQVMGEKDVNYYEIERSTDGKNFKPIGNEIAKNNPITQPTPNIVHHTSYIVHDPTPQYGVNYYRLNIVERNGNSHYSPIQSVVFEDIKQLKLTIYPNPTTDVLNIQFKADKAQILDFELFDLTGRRVYNYTLSAKEGNNHLFFHTEQFAAGLYTLKMMQGGHLVSVEKVLIE
jgi:hypothetical protein